MTTRPHVELAGLAAATILVLAGCASARSTTPPARLVAPSAWNSVVDCVMLSARASELYAELDTAGISVTPGFTPLAQNRATSRAGVIGTVRISRVPQADGLRITAEASNWDAPAIRPGATQPHSATRAVARQLDAQCLATYPVIGAE